jgi:phosphoserine phosphatase RsbX
LDIRTTNCLDVVEWGVATRSHSGPGAFGDLYLVKAFANGILVAVVDGLGQGNQAAVAARTAVSVLRKYASDSVISLVKRCHRTLMMSRGAVITLARLDLHAKNLNWLGVGNVEGVLLRADAAAVPASERLQLHGGLIGYQLPKLHAHELSIQKGDLLVFATDGISNAFTRDMRRNDSPQQIADDVLEKHFKGTDDGLVLALRYLGGTP